MKIILTVHQFLPDFFAGTEILTFGTARELQRLGHQVLVLTGFPGRDDLPDEERFDRYLHEGVPVERFHHAPVAMGEQTDANEAEFDNRFFACHFREVLLEFKPDLVHFFHLARLSASPMDVCHELGVPMVMTPTDFWLICPTCQLRLPDNAPCSGPDCSGTKCLMHMDAIDHYPDRSWLSYLPYRLLTPLMAANSLAARAGLPAVPFMAAFARRREFLRSRMALLDRVIIPTRLMEKILVEHGLSRERVTFSRFGIDTTRITPRIKGGGETLRIGFIGMLSEHKGAHLLLQAVRALSRKEWLVKVYGDPTAVPAYAAELEKLAAGDRRIAFCGTFPNDRIGEVFAELDVLVVPSLWYENTPLVLYSAQAAACPVVATDLGGISEVIHHGENGLLFPVGDVTGLTRALESLMGGSALLRKLSEGAVPPKTIAQYVQDLLPVYAQVTS